VAKDEKGKEGRWTTEKEKREKERDDEKGKTRAGMPAIKEV